MNTRPIKSHGERRILNEGGERRGGSNPGIPGRRPAPPPPIIPPKKEVHVRKNNKNRRQIMKEQEKINKQRKAFF